VFDEKKDLWIDNGRPHMSRLSTCCKKPNLKSNFAREMKRLDGSALKIPYVVIKKLQLN